MFQQYIVDAYAKIESQRLDWVLQNQQKLRTDSLSGLLDFLHSANDTTPSITPAVTTVPPPLASAGSSSTHTPNVDNLPASSRTVSSSESQPPGTTGRPVILPATFGGSPRALHQAYLDSMAIVARYGKPDFFLTITANPSWPEIQRNLRPGETAADRPDLVARVFYAKFRRLLQLLTEEHFFGKAVAWTWVIEFQKRGLPHGPLRRVLRLAVAVFKIDSSPLFAWVCCVIFRDQRSTIQASPFLISTIAILTGHILLIVVAEAKPRTPSDIDALVSAEIPDPETQPALYALVETHMVHGPCGVLNPSCPCMKDGLCSKNYPKRFVSETTLKVDGYPEYRRRVTVPLRTVKRGVLDTRSVVPHNLALLELFDCHLNVEICTSIKAVKYLYKYTYKGVCFFGLQRQYHS